MVFFRLLRLHFQYTSIEVLVVKLGSVLTQSKLYCQLVSRNFAGDTAHHARFDADRFQLSTVHVLSRARKLLKAIRISFKLPNSGLWKQEGSSSLDALMIQLPSVNLQDILSGRLVRQWEFDLSV